MRRGNPTEVMGSKLSFLSPGKREEKGQGVKKLTVGAETDDILAQEVYLELKARLNNKRFFLG